MSLGLLKYAKYIFVFKFLEPLNESLSYLVILRTIIEKHTQPYKTRVLMTATIISNALKI